MTRTLRLLPLLVFAAIGAGCDTHPTPNCKVDNDCCGFGPAYLCGTDQVCAFNPFVAQDPNVYQYRVQQCQGGTPNPNPNPNPGGNPTPQCRTYPAGVAPSGTLPYPCGPVGNLTAQIMSSIDQFWMSSASACSCYPGQPAECQGNAFAPSPATGSFGIIYYDPNVLQKFAQVSGSLLGPAWFVAHEFGHEIQFKYGTVLQPQIENELGADCYSGYFAGWLACTGQITERDVAGTMLAICQGGDPVGVPWFDPSAHGSCQQRQQAYARGLQTYSQGLAPLNSCTGGF